MPHTAKYVDRNPTKTGEFSGRLNAENHLRLDLYCKINNLNKTQVLNTVMKKFLDEKFSKLKETE